VGVVVSDPLRVALNTSTGQQTLTFTWPDGSSYTPKAVLLIATRCVTDGTAADGGGFYVGASDGTNEWTEGYESQHAVASMNSYWNQDVTANRILTIYNGAAGGTVEATADFVSFGSNTCVIDLTDAPASAFLLTVIAFSGSDLTAAVGTSDLGNTADAAIDITTVGFEADVVLTFLTEDGSAQGPNVGMGLIHNDRGGTVTQRCVVHSQRDSFGTSQVGVQYRDGECIARLIESTQAIDWHGAAGSFDSSGFTVQLGNARSPNNGNISWIALRLGTSPAVSAKVYTLSTPTGTGSATDAGAGFEPQFVMYLPTRAAAADTSETDADGGVIGLLVTSDGATYTNSISDEDAAADSNTQSLSDNQLTLPTHTGAAAHAATFTSFGATGVTWNWTATDATARLWPALAIGINAGGTTYEETPSGAITPAGVVVLRTAKPLAGALTSAGTLVLRAAKVLEGAITPSGVVNAIKTALVAVGGTLTSAGVVLARANKTLDGAVTSAGGLVLSARKVLEGTLTSAGTLANRTAKVLAGAITPSGVVNAIKTALVAVGGTLTSAGVLVLQASKVLGGTLAPDGSVLRSVSKFMAGTLTSAGDVLKRTAKALSGALTSSGTASPVLTSASPNDTNPAAHPSLVRQIARSVGQAANSVRQSARKVR
jgi:hypothetical protein